MSNKFKSTSIITDSATDATKGRTQKHYSEQCFYVRREILKMLMGISINIKNAKE